MSNTYDDNVKLWKKAYQGILEVCEKYRDFDNKYSFRDIDDMQNAARGHLMLVDWYEKYGLKIDHGHNPHKQNWVNTGEYTAFSRFYDAEADKANGSGRFISWSDDGRQPNNEWLFIIGFSTGAYIFGYDYEGQQQLFQDFIGRLKSYKPDYSDTVNKSFYWKLENAKPIYDDFGSVLREYREKNRQELDKRKAEKLREQLAELEGKAETPKQSKEDHHDRN